ncbi:hypothetical protein [Liquorilactobacillus capillatus]|uniref:Uncharacterized protein n=1 Tax=Liquorilactobacillus capillatus DSM 19910 TaxID=1423731 RepID=A0A0R1MAG5_9LACO|nr:hypothetical protein [Liquorilactobacillus capillatus]KRL01211.1 hypothetical protein FC81_GL001352 [Liquorilactobacillus capillatus DSM 19910]
MNSKAILHPRIYTVAEIAAVAQPYWAYVIFIALLNTVVITTVTQREVGYYKEFYFIVGSKWLIFIANFIVQTIFILCEVLAFSIVVMLALHSWYSSILISGFLTVLLAVLPVTMFLSILFIFRIKQQSLSIIGTFLIFVLFYLATLRGGTWLAQIVLLLNPYKFILVLSEQLTNVLTKTNLNLVSISQLLVMAGIFCILGLIGFSRFDIRPILERA